MAYWCVGKTKTRQKKYVRTMRKTQYDIQTMTNAPTVILNGVFAVQIVVTAAAPYVT